MNSGRDFRVNEIIDHFLSFESLSGITRGTIFVQLSTSLYWQRLAIRICSRHGPWTAQAKQSILITESNKSLLIASIYYRTWNCCGNGDERKSDRSGSKKS